ncbi:MAG TPA: hypothetical protein VJZ04_05195 [Lachnospiraceae bacterium]|nr:hypothetical protein [Lachnospiraceae bacterium]
MQEAFSTSIQLYKAYSGSSMYLFLFLIALLYLWITEEEKATKIAIIYVVLAIFILFFIPWFAYFAMEYFLDYEVYYRMLWLIPMGAIVSYGGVTIIARAKNKKRQFVIICLIILLIGESGINVFNKVNFQKSENEYHVPQIVVEIMDVIKLDEYKVRVAFPAELVEYPRQITAQVFMPYGREILIERWNNQNLLYDEIQAETLNAEKLSYQAYQNNSECVVLSNKKAMEGSMEDHGFVKIATVENYDIYMVTWLRDFMKENGWK